MLKVHVQKLGDAKVFCLRGGIGVAETSVLRSTVAFRRSIDSPRFCKSEQDRCGRVRIVARVA
jgi:hypothetical protein